ncbi:MAG: NAD(P)-dependent oxidoreductase, partial [Gammaproteobacteria bacterium]
MESMRIALLGTGLMGQAAARRLLSLGYPLKVYNRTPEKAIPLRREGAEVAGSVQEALEGAEAV